MIRRFLVAAAALGAVAIAPAPALAKSATSHKVYAPPGKAGASEYYETLPASGGNVKPPTSSTYAPSGKSASSITAIGSGKQGAAAVAKLGKRGKAAAGLAEATAPARVRTTAAIASSTSAGTETTSRQSGANASHTSFIAASSSSGGSAARAILKLLGGSDDGGIGVFLPLSLAFSLGLAAGIAGLRVTQRRRRSARS